MGGLERFTRHDTEFDPGGLSLSTDDRERRRGAVLGRGARILGDRCSGDGKLILPPNLIDLFWLRDDTPSPALPDTRVICDNQSYLL